MKISKLFGLLLMMAVLVPTALAVVPDGWTHEDIERGYQLVPERKVSLTTTIINPHLRYVWDGRMWMLNPNISTWTINGRTYIRYGAWPQ